ncbi:MAG: IclR family transcriptional regulator [Acidimicrobiales bacterium]|nr:IclR family transcriptional regulator [Acidimicrobiales bacterium]
MASVQSVQRAFAILRALSSSPMGVTQVSNIVGLPKSTVARLLAALEEENAVVQESSGGKYGIGDGLLDVVTNLPPGRHIISFARPFMTSLAEELGETVGIGIREGDSIYYLDHVGPDTEVRVRDWTGHSAPLHLVPSGLVALAHLEKAELVNYLEGPLTSNTANSVTDPVALQVKVDEVRKAGYAWGLEEFAEGLNSVAAPITDSRQSVVAFLHAHGPAYRFPGTRKTADLGPRLQEICQDLGNRLA